MTLPISQNFNGWDEFCWFLGVVEGRQDPLFLGRVQVRVIALHSQSLNDIPSTELPWASVMESATGGQIFGTPKEGSVVFGFFADGTNGQLPIIIGILPGIPTQRPNTGQGFNDLRTPAQIQLSPKKPVSRKYNTDGSGIQITELDVSTAANQAFLRHPTPDELDQPSYSGVTRNVDLANTVIQARKTNLDTGVTTATGINWSEPYPAFNPLYPYNNAVESESGHVVEIDDTPGNERLAMTHRTGTFWEMYPDGTKVEKVTRSKYEIVMADDYVHIMGKAFVTVSGNAYVQVTGDAMIDARNDLNLNVAGDLDVSVGGALNFKASSMSMDVSDGLNIKSGGDANFEGQSVNILGDGGLTLSGAGPVQAMVTSSLTAGSLGSGFTPVASPAQVPGIPSPPGALSYNNATVTPEKVPVPLVVNLTELDAFQGEAFTQQQFLIQNSDGTYSQPSTITPSIASQKCTFDAKTANFVQTPWIIDQAGINLIEKWEGFSSRAYPDPVTGGQPITIGYGTTGPAIGQTISLGEMISQATAEQYLLEVVNNNLIQMAQVITVPLTQNQVNALSDLIYNIGFGNFAGSTLLRDLNAGNYCQAAKDFGMWCNAKGIQIQDLVNRRSAESQLFMS